MLVSVVTPTFNRNFYLRSIVACFLAQTCTDSELLVVDDGTESAEPFIAAHPRVRYVRLPGPPLSTGMKRNACCELAQGEFVLHADNDDWSAPTRIANQVEKLKASDKAVLTYYRIPYWDMTEKQAYIYNSENREPLWEWAHGATLCYRKSFWEEHPFEDKRRMEDVYFIKAAGRADMLASTDGRDQIVLRAHSGNTYAPPLHRMLKTESSDLPAQFFTDNELNG
jgi:glycosyltransferase involved in cell wall biosynthesis